MKTKIISLKKLDSIDLGSFAKSYQDIYGAKPWNEFKKCANPLCHEHWGTEQKPELDLLGYRHCDLEVIDYWSTPYLLDEFNNLSNKPEFNAIFAFDSDLKNIVGFCLGYQINLFDIDKKMEMVGVKEKVLKFSADVDSLIYLSDIAVDANYRGKGIAKKLISDFLEINSNSRWVITRTKGGDEPSVSNSWFYRLGFNLLAPYGDIRGREIQFAEISNLAV